MKKRIPALALALILILALAACGAASPQKAESYNMENADGYDMAMTSQATGEGQYKLDGFSAAEAESGSAGAAVQNPDKIIFTGSATVETQKFDETIAAIEALASDIGGYIQSSSVNGNDFHTSQYGGGSYRSAYYELRVPADSFRSVMDGLQDLGNVSASSVNADNVTEQYADVEARLTACKAEEARYLELLGRANSVEEMLQIESYLSDVRYEIESYTAQIKNWDSRISYSTVCLNVQEVSLYSDTTPATIGYGKQLGNALTNSAKAVWQFLKNVLKFIVSALPVLPVIAIAVAVIVVIVRAVAKKRRKGKDDA